MRTGLDTRREINRFLLKEDPYATTRVVELRPEHRAGRVDLDIEMIVAVLDWSTERLEDELRTEQFLSILQRALGTPASRA